MFRSGGFWVYFPSPHLLSAVPRTVQVSSVQYSAVQLQILQLRSDSHNYEANQSYVSVGLVGSIHFHFPLTSLPLLDIFKFWVKIEPNLTSIWAKLYFSTIETRGKCLTFYKIHFVLCLFTLKHIQIREALSLKQVGWNNFIISSPMSWFHNKLSDHN